jgi:hypothetical protein
MPNLFQRLSVRVMRTILTFLLLLGLATAGVTLLGFHDTQKDAAERSGQALAAPCVGWLLHLALVCSSFLSHQSLLRPIDAPLAATRAGLLAIWMCGSQQCCMMNSAYW